MTALKIAVSACFMHPDPNRNVFSPKTLLYIEQSMAHWLVSEQAIPFLIPTATEKFPLKNYMQECDGLLLQGGADICPKTYKERAIKPEWEGDFIRDQYELELIQLFREAQKPILGICRGAQLLNVAFGGTLYQDIQTQNPDCIQHRDAKQYDKLHHDIVFSKNSLIEKLFPQQNKATVNSVHHQAIKDLANDFFVEAYSEQDKIIEAFQVQNTDNYIYGIQWHPEFSASLAKHLNSAPLLQYFLSQCQQRKANA